MRHFEYLRLRFHDGNPQVTCTHQDTLKGILSEVKRLIPGVKTRDVGKDLSGEYLSYRLHKLDGRDSAVFFWILKWLCQKGWEPFTVLPEPERLVAGGYSYYYYDVYHFRKEIQS